MIKLNIRCERPSFLLEIEENLPSKGIIAIFGRSGAGKTMFINAISGLISPDQGRISFGDLLLFDSKKKINLPPEKRSIGYVFQDSRLFPHMSVQKNLLYAFKGKQAQLDEIIALLELEHLLKRYPKNLSGGEKQRVAIGRALLSEPKLLIMDEPTASLDLARRNELCDYLLRITHSLSIPLLYITHHLDEVMKLADHMLVLDKGKVVGNGDLHQTWHLASMQPEYTAKAYSSLLNAKVIATHNNYPLTALELGEQRLWIPQITQAIGSFVRLRVFAADISIAKTKPCDSSIRNLLAATVIKIVPHADNTHCYVSLAVGDQEMVANITQWAADELELALGMQVYAQLKGISIARKDISLTANTSAIKC